MARLALRSMVCGLAIFLWAAAAWTQPAPAAQFPAPDESPEFSRLRDQALEEAEAGKNADAMRDFRQALALEPGWTEGWWNLGMLQYTASQFSDAETTFQRVAVLAPNAGIAWGVLGLCRFETKNYDDALANLEKAQSLGMKSDEEIARVAEYHLALLWVRAGRFDQASQLLAAGFGTGAVPEQARIALGLATLRVPLLPDQLDPSREALLSAAGDAAISGDPGRFATVVRENPKIPYLHFAWCGALAQARRYHEALDACFAETKISPESSLPWVEIGHLQLLQAQLSAALKSAQTAVRLSPSSAEAHRMLAQAEDASGRATEADKERSKASQLSPLPPSPEERIVALYANASVSRDASQDAAQARWQQALREYVAANYAAAAEDLKAWLGSDPSSGTGWALLGLCEYQLRDYDSALIHLDRGSRLGLNASNQSIDEARTTYGILLVHAGRFDEAESVLFAAWHPDSPLRQKIEFVLGLALLRRTEFPDQIPSAQQDLIASAGRIGVLLEQSQYDQAFPQFKTLLDRYPAAPFLHYAYGTALMAMSEFDPAAAEMQAERTISPHSELPCLRLASISLRQEQSAPAVQWAQCALELNPNSVDAHYLLGRASLENGDLTTAIRELEIASTLSPESPEIHFNLARAYARAKMPDKAQRERDLFSRLNDAQKSSPPPPAHP
jgi:tetratricopeptide (TPR) repeat protein